MQTCANHCSHVVDQAPKHKSLHGVSCRSLLRAVLPDGLDQFSTDERVEKAPFTVILAIVNVLDG